MLAEQESILKFIHGSESKNTVKFSKWEEYFNILLKCKVGRIPRRCFAEMKISISDMLDVADIVAGTTHHWFVDKNVKQEAAWIFVLNS